MHSEDSDVRVLAAEQWGPIGNSTVIPMLKRALDDSSPYVRIAAAGSLYELGDSSGVVVVEGIVAAAPKAAAKGDLMSALEEMRAITRNKVRVTAIRTLSIMGRPSSFMLLQKTASDRDGAVRDAAAVALARMGEGGLHRRFVKALGEEDAQLRLNAVKALGQMGGEASVDPLAKLTGDTDYHVRAAVMEALGNTGSVLALPALKDGIQDQNELVRSRAVAALGRIDSPASIPLLRETLNTSTNVYIEMLALAGLARLGEKVEVQAAQRALAQPDADTRMLAVEVLETVGGPAAIENLDLALEDRELRIRVRAAAALVRLLQRKGGK